MRLLSVILGPTFGGAHNQALRLADPLRALGVETTVVVPAGAEPAAERLTAARVDTVRVALHRPRATASPGSHLRVLRALPADVAAIRRVIRDRDADVVQVHGPNHPHGAFAARREAGVGLVWQLLDTRTPMSLRRVSMPYVVRAADAITAWGRGLGAAYPGAAGLEDRLICVYPPVAMEEFAPDAERRRRARERLEAGSSTVIGAVAVLTPQKGHEYLVRAAARVFARRPDARFRILGTPSPAHPEYVSSVRREATELGLSEGGRLTFADPGADVPLLLQGIDILAMSSVRNSEGMPTAVLEAMACGKPVVATDVGAVSELIEDGVTGLLVEPEDERALAAALERLLRNEGERRAMGEAGRRRALERFDLGSLAERHALAYEIAVRHRGGRRRGRRS
jgi:glycosyltransferase involved in cell wall biosynthesis